MNIHKNARLTFARRLEMVRNIVEQGLRRAWAASEAGVSEPTARKWLESVRTFVFVSCTLPLKEEATYGYQYQAHQA
jgi:hypothetical protein